MIRSKRRARVFTFAVGLLAASFLYASIEASRVHTDDGCQVELHCFACHWGFATTGVIAVAFAYGPVLEHAGGILLFPMLLPVEATPPRTVSRGPPTS